jgi:hypothetical protein
MPPYLEAFDTLKLRLISAPCLILPDVIMFTVATYAHAMFTVATNASIVGIATLMLQSQGRGLQPISHWARKLIHMSVATPTLPMIWKLWLLAKRLSIGGGALKGALSSFS